jgi:predicted AlkP superfamily pyrophosphatase or phosphodiesterase
LIADLMKKVLLVVIDALASRVIQPAMNAGRLPNLQAVVAHGEVDWRSTAIFPSITPAATGALITGGYPRETGIAGAYFYDKSDDQVHYYADDIWPILNKGIGEFFNDFLIHLNRDQLRLETLFQRVERHGGRAACLNYLWFHGEHIHKVHIPWLLKILPGVPFATEVEGPAVLSLGDFVSSRLEESGEKLQGHGGLKHRYGFDDVDTSDVLLQLAQSGPLPDLTVAYFPDNDFDSHEIGPAASVETVEKVDATLGELFAISGGLENFLKHTAIVVTGDHAQSDLPLDTKETGIDLDELLHQFALVPIGKRWSDDDDLMVCPNMRAAQIYVRPRFRPRFAELVNTLLAEPRIDQVIWREAAEGDVGAQYHVATTRGENLRFWHTGEADALAQDEYGGTWAWSGDLSAVDGSMDRDGVLRFGDYPNAFERIATAFDQDVSGDLWITSRVSYELGRQGASIHEGGSHGSLHALDSLSPLIFAGAPRPADWKQTARSVDVAPLCASILGLPPWKKLGISHTGE